MGLIQFQVHPPEAVTAEMLDRACFVGIDLVPWPTRVRRTPSGFVIERDSHESGNFRLPWPVAGRGEPMISTASLMERAAPYQLEVELARGKLNQLRNQMADWQAQGLVVPPAVLAQVQAATVQFGLAATRQNLPGEAAQAAARSLALSVAAADALTAAYADQAIAARRRQLGKLDTQYLLGLGQQVPGDDASRWLSPTFDGVVIPLPWWEMEAREDHFDWTTSDRQFEWAGRAGVKVTAGPLLRFDRVGLPDWLYLWAGDPGQLAQFAAQFVLAAAARYRGKVQAWYAVARLSAENNLDLDEEHTLRIAMAALESLRQVDRQTPVLLGIDQPWADHQGRSERDLSPWHFADALARSELGLGGVVLELAWGYEPGGVPARDALELSRLLDFWGLLGLPVYLNLAVPSSSEPDPGARSSARPSAGALAEGLSATAQRAWLERYLPVCLAKPFVRGVWWDQAFETAPHDLPHAGLFDAQGQPKPALTAWAQLRQLSTTWDEVRR